MGKSVADDPARAVDWDAVRRDYETEGLTTNGICRKHGVTADVLAVRARRHRWKDIGRAGTTDRAILIRQAFAVLERQVQNLETTEMKDAGEKEAAVLGKLVATLDKLIEIDNRTTGGQAPAQKREALELRARLVQRIEENKKLHGA